MKFLRISFSELLCEQAHRLPFNMLSRPVHTYGRATVIVYSLISPFSAVTLTMIVLFPLPTAYQVAPSTDAFLLTASA